ncbi:MAG: oxidoreductase, partial [Chloroflexi bacterium]|nr:oxidoreductase [Chloroflexota bacterium]
MLGWEARTGGTERYAGDLPVEGVLTGRIVRSPHPHAEILAIDTAAAERAPGVRAVITHVDFPPGARYIHSGGATSDRAPLAERVVRYVGEEVAAL